MLTQWKDAVSRIAWRIAPRRRMFEYPSAGCGDVAVQNICDADSINSVGLWRAGQSVPEVLLIDSAISTCRRSKLHSIFASLSTDIL